MVVVVAPSQMGVRLCRQALWVAIHPCPAPMQQSKGALATHPLNLVGNTNRKNKKAITEQSNASADVIYGEVLHARRKTLRVLSLAAAWVGVGRL